MVRFTDAELDMVETASAKDGLVLASWIAEAALALADPEAPMTEGRATRAELDVVQQATQVVKRNGYLFNQAVAALNATGEAPEELIQYGELTWRSVARLEDEVIALRQKRRSR